MNWYKTAKLEVKILGYSVEYNNLSISINGKQYNYQLPYPYLVEDVAGDIRRAKGTKLSKYIRWLDRFIIKDEVKIAEARPNYLEFGHNAGDVMWGINWYKKANQNIGDLYEGGNPQNPLGERIFKSRGVWLYPFKDIKKDFTEGWYIDWFDGPGSINDIEQVNIGDKVADFSLNMTPYWEVNGVNADSGKIYLTAIEPNPFITGVGAGGAEITENDLQVHTGEYERERIDSLLDVINKRLYASPDDVAYILKGTVPVHFGPNGSQGGWYAPMSMSNRGYSEGLDAKTIMVSDAQNLQKLGFEVPSGSLDGTLDPRDWSDFVKGTDQIDPYLQVEGEDYDNIETSKQYLLTATEPKRKIRNFKAIVKKTNIYNEPTPQKESIFIDLAKQVFNMFHPTIDRVNFDVYWHLKEYFILMAQKFKWWDILSLYEKSYDTTNRKDVAWAYGFLAQGGDDQDKRKAKNRLLKMEEVENSPEVLTKIVYGLTVCGIPTDELYRYRKDKYDRIFQSGSPDDYYLNEFRQIFRL